MTEDYTLAPGAHATPADGRCAMEWVSHLAGEPHSDSPTCVSPVLRALCVTLNDGLPDGPRQRLRPLLARTIGTAGDGLDAARGWTALDWLVRVHAPAWLDLAGLGADARALREHPVLDRPAALTHALGPLAGAAAHVRTRRDAAWADAGPVRGRIDARIAARRGREAAWGCAGAGAWAAVRAGVAEERAEEARRLLRALAGDGAAVALSRVAPDDVCGAHDARGARRLALGPTLEALADAALALLSGMLVTHALPLPAGPRPAPLAPALA